jgi:hypothetical protein
VGYREQSGDRDKKRHPRKPKIRDQILNGIATAETDSAP